MMFDKKKLAQNIGKCVLIIWMLCFGIAVKSQIVSSAGFVPDTVLIGDEVSVEITITLPRGVVLKGLDMAPYLQMKNKIYTIDTNFMDAIADIDVLDWGDWKHTDVKQIIGAEKINIKTENNIQTIHNTIKIAIYNMGVFDIPGPEVICDPKSESLPVAGKSLTVRLPESIMKQDSIAFNPINDIMREKANISDYLIYLYSFIGLLIMTMVGYYFYKIKKKKESIAVVPEMTILLPHEKALQALVMLDQKQLWQKGEIKMYQTDLTDIIRHYIEDRYQVNAPEMTTDEITASLRKLDFDVEYSDDLREILQIADLVKFAKAVPENDIHSRFMSKAIAFVEKTKIV
ncbi:MAG: hypothetical protein IPO92_02925 [Saprospiraceae bacterium]|nr:hypothetical protein [Saprospiraceae bacterium]